MKNNEDIERYNDSNRKIDNLIFEIRPYIEKDKDSNIYLRNLTNMFEAYKADSTQLINQVLNLEQLDSRSYDKLTELKTLFTYTNKHAQYLVVSYLHYSNLEYSDTVMIALDLSIICGISKRNFVR